MPITISGSTGIAGVDGSASTPAVQGTDTNTGIAFPAADTVAVATGGSERMRVDSSGNVGIGTTSPGQKLDVNGVIQTNNDIYINNAVQYKVVGFYHSGTRKSYVAYDNTNNWLNITAEAASSSILFQTAAAPVAKIDSSANFQFNSGYGSVATAYGCRAWVYFNGTGTVAINGSGNVTSITDNGTGTYTVNFTTAMPDANYAVTGTCSNNDNNRNESGTLSYGSSGTYSTTAVQVWTVENTGSSTVDVDMPRISVAIFR